MAVRALCPVPCGRGVALQPLFLESPAQAKEKTEAETKGEDVSGLTGKGVASKGSEGQLGLSRASFPQNEGLLGWVKQHTVKYTEDLLFQLQIDFHHYFAARQKVIMSMALTRAGV